MEVKKYLVIMEMDGETSPSLNTASQIISWVDMSDCTGASFKVFDLTTGQPVELQLHGCWHDMKNPLYIKATDGDGNIVFDGWGTDH